MKVIIAGGRRLAISRDAIDWIVSRSRFEISEVVSGACTGADLAGEGWAKLRGIAIKRFPYESALGLAGGPARNRKMADYADALICMIIQMAKRRKPLYVQMAREE